MMQIQDIIDGINLSEQIDINKSFEYSQICSKLIKRTETRTDGRKIIIHILDNWHKINEHTRCIWIDLLEAEGFYPYLDKERFEISDTAGALRKEMSKSKNLEYYLHDEQLYVKQLLDSNKNVIVSAPTSFGKSLLIEELVAEKQYRNIVIIQPTLALLDETRKKLKKYDDHYNIIVRTSQEYSTERSNLFLLTAERVMEYHELPKIDLLIIDEFYKLSAKRNDERSDVLNNAFYSLLKRDNVKFYLLGPNIDGISPGFEDKYNAVFYKTDYSLVEQLVEERFSNEFGIKGQKKINKENALFNLLFELIDEQTIVYCSSPARARYLAKKFLAFLDEKIHAQQYTDEIKLIEWIEKYVNKDWILAKCLKNRIAFHDGALQKHITSSVVKYFNEKKLNYLFCTSTLIEGVNTSAKNIIIFDNKKGTRKEHIIDYFDYSNIKGRAGRMMVHYIGKVYNFNPPMRKSNDLIVDIPFFQQNPIKDEVLIHLDESNVINKTSDQYKKIEKIPHDEQILFKRNGVLVDGQIKILQQLRTGIVENLSLVLWSGYPNYNQLEYVLRLGWGNLLKPTETTRPMTLNKLIKITFDYGMKQSIDYLIKSNIVYITEHNAACLSSEDILDEAIRDAFNILRHWFQYKVPKWLRTINLLQEFICLEKGLNQQGNYLFYADKIESDFIRENLSILAEYGIPKSAIQKIGNYIEVDLNESEVIKIVKDEQFLSKIDLLEYEKETIINGI